MTTENEVTAEMVDLALNAWFASPPSETDQGLERSMRAAVGAALRAQPATVPSEEEIAEAIHNARWGDQAWSEATLTARNGECQIARAVVALLRCTPSNGE